jgi:exopolysaccharide biosynthesis protein
MNLTQKNRRRVLFGNRPKPSSAVKTAASSAPKKTRRGRRLLTAGIIIIALGAVYLTAMFSDIPFVKKWREIYIETAMDTYSHKWLATAFIPKSVIDEVINKKEAYINGQQSLESSWVRLNELPYLIYQGVYTPPLDVGGLTGEKLLFYKRFTVLDPKSLEQYLAVHPDLVTGGYGKLLINETDAPEADRSELPKTVHGDPVLVIDSENGIVIAEVKGEGYVGKLALVSNPAQVHVGVSKYLGSSGQTVETIAKNNNAILAVNASGFADPEWKGNGGLVVGLLIKDGVILNKPYGHGYLNIGFARDDRLYIGVPVQEADYRDAVEFMPALIINGKNVTDGSTGFGIQPRTAIGQAADGTVMFLTVDGRQVGYSLGCTVGDCADVLAKYGALQASNLDGGSSTIMVYRGEVINKPSSTTSIGRLLPDAFIVDYASSAKAGS